MKMPIRSLITGFLAVALITPAAFAQDRRAFGQPELDQMLAPIALYPDALLSQVLMAATYPLEVVQAARWTRANPQFTGDDAVRAVESMDWDPSVKSLVAFAQILDRMDEKLDWTERLGEAFLAQEAQVMDTIQGLRHRAAVAGNLGPNDQTRVVRQGDQYVIEPADPRIVYVPYYNPVVAYGSWWWPAYQPVYWAPWPGYYARPGYAPGYLWGSGIVIRTGFFFGFFNWPQRQVTVVHHHPAPVIVNRHVTVIHRTPVRWEHDPHHRRGAPYRYADTRDFRHVQRIDDDRRPGRMADTPSSEPGSSSQSSPRTQPPAPRTDPRTSSGASDRDDRRAGRADGAGNSARPEPRNFTKGSPRTNARPSGSALDREDREARRPVAAAAQTSRRAGHRADDDRPAAAARENAPATAPSASRDSAGPRANARSSRGALDRDDREARRAVAVPALLTRSAAAHAEARPAAATRSESARQAPDPAVAPAPAMRGAGFGNSRQARDSAPISTPPARDAAPRADNEHPRAAARKAAVAER